ncbi:FkbM family methyltransferase [Actinacidiphila soli]|uniref:FkbM family methyltransferase n=1 Tax=Actinacidiphila soli TaxID=2487275 RepID=UPI000FCC76B1|nr:FkbM family methyltransferase [Actinacidiphila soli]
MGKTYLPPLALVRESAAGEDADFNERFRRERLKRWAYGVRNGMSLLSLMGFRLGLSDSLTFQGVRVPASDNQVTCRIIEDIWMRGEYDLPGFIPQPGWRVVDIGGNVGIFAMLAASRGARVISYEPFPETYERLRVNTRRWDVQCHHAAVVGRAAGPVRLFVHQRHTRNSLLPPEPGQGEEAFAAGIVEVPSVSMAGVLATPCDLLKVDCEGSEFDLFAQAGDSLRHASRIIAEVHAHAGDPDTLAGYVRDSGFAVELHAPYPGTSFSLLTAVRR